MIEFLLGPPGEGKSYGAVNRICERLVMTDDEIHTNINLHLPELFEYIRKKYGTEIDTGRIHICSDQEVRKFWHYMGGGFYAQSSSDKVNPINYEECVKHEGDPDFEEVKHYSDLPKVFKVFDEFANYFPAAIQSQGFKGSQEDLECGHCRRQHRKLGWDILLIAQDHTDVVASIRKMVKRYTVSRNLGNETALGVKMPNAFIHHEYNGEPTGSNKPHVEGLGRCYDTMAGVGMEGGGVADSLTETRKGWSIKQAVAIGVAAVCLVGWIIGYGIPGLVSGIGKKIVKTGDPKIKGTNVGRVKKLPAQAPQAKPIPQARPITRTAQVRQRRPLSLAVERENFAQAPEREWFIAGYTRMPNAQREYEVRLILSNGRKWRKYTYSPFDLRRHDWEVEVATPRLAVISGKLYRFNRDNSMEGSDVWMAPAVENEPYNLARAEVMQAGQQSAEAGKLIRSADELMGH
jgi:hypothetical protein